MKKYYIGLIAIALLCLGLTIYTAVLGLSGRQDRETEKRADEIATKLNTYVSDNQKIPASLEEAGVTNVPSSIRYTKKSDSQFEFCATYKAEKKSGFGGYDPLAATLMGGYPSSSYYSDSSYGSSTARQSYLYMDYYHTKGENCKTVEPYLYDFGSDTYDFNSNDYDTYESTDINEYCQPTHEYYDIYKDYCVNGKIDWNAPQSTEPELMTN